MAIRERGNLATQSKWLLLLVAAVCLSAVAHGQRISLEVSPPIVRYALQPGASASGSFNVRNDGNSPLPVTILPSDFVQTLQGTIHPIPAGSLPQSAASWVTLSASAAGLQPNTPQAIRYTISVPPGTKDGSYWMTALIRSGKSDTQKTSTGTSVRYVGQVAFVLIVDVGTPRAGGKITDISAANGSRGGGGKRSVRIRFQNSGTAYLLLKGRVELRALDGTLVTKLNAPTSASFPGEVSDIDVSVPTDVKAGSYVATAILDDGSTTLITGQKKIDLGKTQ